METVTLWGEFDETSSNSVSEDLPTVIAQIPSYSFDNLRANGASSDESCLREKENEREIFFDERVLSVAIRKHEHREFAYTARGRSQTQTLAHDAQRVDDSIAYKALRKSCALLAAVAGFSVADSDALETLSDVLVHVLERFSTTAKLCCDAKPKTSGFAHSTLDVACACSTLREFGLDDDCERLGYYHRQLTQASGAVEQTDDAEPMDVPESVSSPLDS